MTLTVCVKVWGPLAVFTRPELKVERLSYPAMTPSAARGILDAIMFKPQMYWNVQRITILKRGQHLSFRRNEIQGKIAPAKVMSWMREPGDAVPYLVDSAGREGVQGQNRTQRNTVALRDVAYLIHANPVLTDRANKPRTRPLDADEPEGEDTPIKYVGMFNRRVAKGQCFHRPYLGCREFACSFAAPDGCEKPLDWSESLGLMLYDIYFGRNGDNLPGFFEARVNQGVLHCDRLNPGSNKEPPITVYGWPIMAGQ